MLTDIAAAFQDLYDKLKRKMLLANVQSAANETAENLAMGGMMMGGHDQMQQSHGGNMGGGGHNRFVGGGMDNPISVDDMNGNMGNMRVSGAIGGGGGGGGQGAGCGINNIFVRGGNVGGGGVGSIRGGGGGRSRNNGILMGIELYASPVSFSFQSPLTSDYYRPRPNSLPYSEATTWRRRRRGWWRCWCEGTRWRRHEQQ